MKKLVSLFFVLLILVSILSACSTSTSQTTTTTKATSSTTVESSTTVSETKAEKKIIGVSLFYKRDEYYMDMEAMLKKLAAENNFEFLIQDADADPTKQTSQFESFIASKVDMIMFAPTDPDGMIPALKAANDAGIPVLAFDAKTNGGKLETVVILDNFKAGEEMGKWAKNYIEKNLGGKAEIAILDFPVATTSCVPRVEGFKSIIESMPDVKIVAQQDGKASRTDSMAVMENILTANPNVNLVFGINDNTIFGAMAAAETKGKNDIVFCDVGWSDELFEKLSTGAPFIKASALASPLDIAKELISAANKYFKGEKLEEITKSPTYVLTTDNAAQFKAEVEAIRSGK